MVCLQIFAAPQLLRCSNIPRVFSSIGANDCAVIDFVDSAVNLRARFGPPGDRGADRRCAHCAAKQQPEAIRERDQMKYSLLHTAVVAALVSSNALAAPADQAQATPEQEAPAAQAKTLDTVVVTGTKRVTPLQKTPVAISAISAETLDKERVMT